MTRMTRVPLLAIIAMMGCAGAQQPSASSPPPVLRDTPRGATDTDDARRSDVPGAAPSPDEESAGASPSPAPAQSLSEPATDAAAQSGVAWSTELADYDQSGAELDLQLNEALTLSTPDCPRAAALRDAICELAARICAIAADHPESESAQEHCDDSQHRCARAGASFEATCGG